MKIKIGYELYNVIFHEDPIVCDDVRVEGYWEGTTQTIHIYKDLASTKKKQVVMHELFHAIENFFNIENVTEDQIQRLSTGILMVLRDNKELVKFLME